MPKKPHTLSINLLPSREQPFSEKFINWSLTYGRYIIIGTEIVVLIAFFSRFKLDRDFIDLKEQVGEKRAVLQTYARTEDTINSLQFRLSEIKKIDAAGGSGILALPQIAILTPNEIRYKDIAIAADKISIVGIAYETADISRFVNILKTADFFKKESVILEKVERSKPEEQGITFTITALVEKEKE